MIEIPVTTNIIAQAWPNCILSQEFLDWAQLHFTPGWFMTDRISPKLVVKCQDDCTAFQLAWGNQGEIVRYRFESLLRPRPKQ